MNARTTSLLLATIAVAMLALPAAAGQKSYDGRYDVDELLGQARSAFPLDQQDSVLLLDETVVKWTDDHRLIRSMHRLVWIGTERGLDDHADLRVPYDGARETLRLDALRTWRLSDQRWIESGPTARVETLPFAVDHAPDYAGRREEMLLHDGVELPCVLETAYTIEDREPFRPGAGGIRLMAQQEPTVVGRFVLVYPYDEPMRWKTAGGVSGPSEGLGEGPGGSTSVLGFEMREIAPRPDPPTDTSVAGLPHVVWSTWDGWDAMGADLLRVFDAAAVAGDDLRAALDEHLGDGRAPEERATGVATFVAGSTRAVHYDAGWWPAPRPANRTWATAYGDRIDRAVLAAAAFRAAGQDARLAFVAREAGDLPPAAAGLFWSDGPVVRVRDGAFEGWFDPDAATLTIGSAWLAGRAAWVPGEAPPPGTRQRNATDRGSISLRLELKYDAKADAWKGTGVLAADGSLSPFGEMAGLDGQPLAYLGQVAKAVARGSKVTGLSPAALGSSRVVTAFDVEVPAGETDDLGRLRFEIGAPPGLGAMLDGAAVRSYEATRGSAVVLPGAIEQSVEVRFEPGDLEVVRAPEDGTLANGAGRAVTAVERDDDALNVTRHLALDRGTFAPEAWPDLRALLLADDAATARVILFRRPAEGGSK